MQHYTAIAHRKEWCFGDHPEEHGGVSDIALQRCCGQYSMSIARKPQTWTTFVYFWRMTWTGWKLACAMNIRRGRDLRLKLLILPLVSSKQYWTVFWSETQFMEASFVDISEKIIKAGYCETVFSQFTEMERYFLMSEMRPSEEPDLPAYEAHPYRSFGGGLLWDLVLALLTGRPTVGRLEILYFFFFTQKVPQWTWRESQRMIPTGYNILVLLFLFSH